MHVILPVSTPAIEKMTSHDATVLYAPSQTQMHVGVPQFPRSTIIDVPLRDNFKWYMLWLKC